MGVLISLGANWGGGTSSALSGLGATTTCSFKLCFRGDLVADMAAFDLSGVVQITGTSDHKLNATVEATADATNIRFGVGVVGDGGNVQIARTAFDSDTYYVWYGHVRPSESPTVYSEVFQLDGTSLGSGQLTYGVTVASGGGAVNILNSGTTNQRARGALDGLAVYTAVLFGADRYTTPSADDANLAALYWFDDESGNTARAAVGNHLTLAGTENIDYLWASGGAWSAPSARANARISATAQGVPFRIIQTNNGNRVIGRP